MSKAKKEITRVYSKQDNKYHDIGMEYHNKLLGGLWMPDYEISQKRFHKFGSVFVNMGHPEYARNIEGGKTYESFGGYSLSYIHSWFQTTGSYIKTSDGTYDYYSFNINNMTMGGCGTSSDPKAKCINIYLVTTDISNITAYFNSGKTSSVSFSTDTSFDDIYYNVRCMGDISNIKIRIPYEEETADGSLIIRVPKDKSFTIKGYFIGIPINICKPQLFYSKNNIWYSHNLGDLKEVNVKKNYMTFKRSVLNNEEETSRLKTAWGISPNIFTFQYLYRGYSTAHHGFSKQHQPSGGDFSFNKSRLKWIQRNQDIADENRLCNLIVTTTRTHSNRIFNNEDFMSYPGHNYAYIDVIERQNTSKKCECFELYRYTTALDNNDHFVDTKTFKKTLTPQQVYEIIKCRGGNRRKLGDI